MDDGQVKAKNGVLRVASWDEALDRAAEGFRATKAEYGGDALATGLVLQRLLDLARGKGARTLVDLEQLQARRRKRRKGKRRSSVPEDMI